MAKEWYFLLAKHCLEEFKLDCQLRWLTDRTIKGYYNNTLNFLIYAEKHHGMIPVYNISIMMQDILNNSMEIGNMGITVVSLLVCSLVVSCVTVVSFRKEAVRC